MKVITTAAEKTQQLGYLIGKHLTKPIVICLFGTLGSGKTTFTKGLAKGLQVPSEVIVTSPTYALLHEYSGGRVPLLHADLYRLMSEDDLENIGFYDFLHTNVVVVEWAERLDDTSRSNALIISLEIQEDRRHIQLMSDVPEITEILEKISSELKGVIS